ncbi:hypothetical protein [Rhizobium sp. RAF56]|uniref:hypothetical protein n=1 Tax=Rhizobium sp. RAF56 TaxID=3233062 RepID=UPI003F995854
MRNEEPDLGKLAGAVAKRFALGVVDDHLRVAVGIERRFGHLTGIGIDDVFVVPDLVAGGSGGEPGAIDELETVGFG